MARSRITRSKITGLKFRKPRAGEAPANLKAVPTWVTRKLRVTPGSIYVGKGKTRSVLHTQQSLFRRAHIKRFKQASHLNTAQL